MFACDRFSVSVKKKLHDEISVRVPENKKHADKETINTTFSIYIKVKKPKVNDNIYFFPQIHKYQYVLKDISYDLL